MKTKYTQRVGRQGHQFSNTTLEEDGDGADTPSSKEASTLSSALKQDIVGRAGSRLRRTNNRGEGEGVRQ